MPSEALASKILVIGIDGMDPRLTRKYLDQGKMPNVRKLLEHGAARHDLVMLGGHPPITPPMCMASLTFTVWTKLLAMTITITI